MRGTGPPAGAGQHLAGEALLTHGAGPSAEGGTDGQLDRHTAESEVRRLLEEFNARVMKARYTPVDGPPLITMPRDVEAEVVAWRERRQARRAGAVRREAPAAPPAPPKRRWWQRST